MNTCKLDLVSVRCILIEELESWKVGKMEIWVVIST